MPSAAPVAGYGAVAGGMAMSEADAQQTAGSLTPSPVTSAWAGLTMASHQTGLQSGGLYGYSTFFTGYRPGEHGAGRRFSLGRAAAEGVSLASQGLRQTPLSNIDAVDDVLKRTQEMSKYGMGVFGNIQSVRPDLGGGTTPYSYGATDVRNAIRAGGSDTKLKPSSAGPAGGGTSRVPSRVTSNGTPAMTDPYRGRNRLQPDPEIDTLKSNSRLGTGLSQAPSTPGPSSKTAARAAPSSPRPFNAADDVAEAMSGNAAIRASDDAGGTISSFFRNLVGGAGGAGYTSSGASATKQAYSEVLGGYVTTAQAGSEGASFLRGALGKGIGAAFRFGGYVELARMGGQAISYAAGEGYESLVQTTEALQRRTGGSNRMSTAYYNRAASTERQRAVQAMDSNRLDPRSQIQGNEAYFMHG